MAELIHREKETKREGETGNVETTEDISAFPSAFLRDQRCRLECRVGVLNPSADVSLAASLMREKQTVLSPRPVWTAFHSPSPPLEQ